MPEIGLDAVASVLYRWIGAHGFAVQLDQPFLLSAAFALVGVYFECP